MTEPAPLVAVPLTKSPSEAVPLTKQPVKPLSKAAPRHRAAQPLPTERLRFEMQLSILTAFARLSGRNAVPIATPAVAQSVSISPATAGLSNMFFVASGWLQSKGKQYAATPALVDYYNRNSMGFADAVTNLARAARQSWYASALLPRLESGPLTVTDVTYILIDAAGASPAHRQQIDMLIEWLRFLGLIAVEDDSVTAVGAAQPAGEGQPAGDRQPAGTRPPAPDQQKAPDSEVPQPTKKKDSSGTDGGGSPQPPIVAFDVSVKVTAEDLRGLQPDQIKALFEAIGTVMSLKGTS
jgi:hypothetical protein